MADEQQEPPFEGVHGVTHPPSMELNSGIGGIGVPPEPPGDDSAGVYEDLEPMVSEDEKEIPILPNEIATPEASDKTIKVDKDLERVVSGDEDNNITKNGIKTTIQAGEMPKKKKKKSKSKSKRGQAAPTGFEEYFVDVPVTPAEFEEEKGLYHESRSFAERIEIAIQRYMARRNFDSGRKDLFDKYMAYGGIEAGQKMFTGGVDTKGMSEMNAAEIALMKARHFVGADKKNEGNSNFVVDFDGCAKAFLSSRLPFLYDLCTHSRIKSHTTVIRNFLNYLLHHDVCPEFNLQIHAARITCEKAEAQLWKATLAQASFPGDFNLACSEIFGGIYQGLHTSGQGWAQGSEVKVGMNPQQARKTFKIGLAAQASKEVFEVYKAQSETQSVGVTNLINTGLIVTGIIPADAGVLDIYSNKICAGLKPLGKLKAETWYNTIVLENEDLTLEEEAAALASTSRKIKEYEFWIEDAVLAHCFLGMKIEATVHELSFGGWYFDAVFGVYCDFYEVLPNELMYGWREPGPVLEMREKVVNGGGKMAVEEVEGNEGGGEEGKYGDDDEGEEEGE